MDEINASTIPELLYYPEKVIQKALYDADIDAEYDGMNWTVSDTKTLRGGQGSVTIGMSLDQDDQLNYQVRKETEPDYNGYVRSWDYHWSSNGSHVFFAYAPKKEQFFEDDFSADKLKRSAYPLGVRAVSDLISIISNYESAKSVHS